MNLNRQPKEITLEISKEAILLWVSKSKTSEQLDFLGDLAEAFIVNRFKDQDKAGVILAMEEITFEIRKRMKDIVLIEAKSISLVEMQVPTLAYQTL